MTTDTLETLAVGLETLAGALRQEAAMRKANGSSIHEDPTSLLARASARHPMRSLGSRQRQVLVVLEEAGEIGTSMRAIARRDGVENSTVHIALTALKQYGIVEKDTSTSPYTYRLSRRLLGDAPAHR
jgi:predicted transcriptional regulator